MKKHNAISPHAFLGTFAPAIDVLALALVVALAGTGTLLFAEAPTYSVLYSFQCGVDGYAPEGGLVRDSAGNLYGITNWSGRFGFGTIFEISASGQKTTLYSFAGSPSDGAFPTAGLVRDRAGNLYGTTNQGGAFDLGTVFELSTGGTETVLHSFGATPSDGEYP